MGMHSERRLARFLLDFLKSSLVGLDNSVWEFDSCLEKRCLDNRKGTQQPAGADKGRLKGQILHPSAVKIYCRSFCEVAYTILAKHFFYCKRISIEIWLGVGLHARCPVNKNL